MSNRQTVYALYAKVWGSIPGAIYDTEELAFRALEWYAVNFGWERRDMNVVSFPVYTKMDW